MMGVPPHDGGPPGLVQARLKGLGDTAWSQWFSCLVSPMGQLLQDLHRLLPCRQVGLQVGTLCGTLPHLDLSPPRLAAVGWTA